MILKPADHAPARAQSSSEQRADLASRPLRRTAEVVGRVLITGGAFYLAVRGVRWSALGDSLRISKPSLLLGVIALNACMMSSRALRLRVCLSLQSAGSLRACFSAVLGSSALNSVLPLRGGDVARLWMLQRSVGIAPAGAIGVGAIEHLMEFSLLALLAFAASLLTTGQTWATSTTPLIVVGTTALLAMLIGSASPYPGHSDDSVGGSASVGPVTAGAWILRQLHTFRSGAMALRDPGLALAAVGLTLFSLFCETGMLILCAKALGLQLSVPLAVVTLFGINLAMALPATPASAGPFEGAVVVVLSLGGIDRAQGLAFGLVYHLIQVVPVTVAGLPVAFRNGRRPAKPKRSGPVQPPHAPGQRPLGSA